MKKGPGIKVAIKKSRTADRAATPLEPEVAASTAAFRSKLNAWYRKHARVLPWRGVNDPYATWLSEIMLQQTRVATVIDRYKGFLLRFPTLRSLARAHENEVLALWSGLGYYRRARMLHRGAQFVARELDGVLPSTSTELRTLPGIGEYTAAAIASIAFGESIAVVDGNVERVVLRLLGLPQERVNKARMHVCRTAQALIPAASKDRTQANAPGDHNQAMMELGATICLPKAPLCLHCPVYAFCRTRGEHPTPPRMKQQSSIVAYLLAVRKSGMTTEVLLEHRSEMSSLMPGMLELPPLPLEAVAGREPVLRVRHAITNTNYYAQIFSEGLTTSGTKAEAQGDAQMGLIVDNNDGDDTDQTFATPQDSAPARSLVNDVPASMADLEWMATTRLLDIPLTGLARKVLQRLGVMEVPKLRID